VSINYDYRAQAQAAMRWAAAATCERERLEWVRIALAWHDLAPTCATMPSTEEVPRAPCSASGADSDPAPTNEKPSKSYYALRGLSGSSVAAVAASAARAGG
jgi:hypothetical protein